MTFAGLRWSAFGEHIAIMRKNALSHRDCALMVPILAFIAVEGREAWRRLRGWVATIAFGSKLSCDEYAALDSSGSPGRFAPRGLPRPLERWGERIIGTRYRRTTANRTV